MGLYFRFFVKSWFSRLALPHFSKVTLELPSSGGKARSGGGRAGGGGGGVLNPKTVQVVMDISWYNALKQQKLFIQ